MSNPIGWCDITINLKLFKVITPSNSIWIKATSLDSSMERGVL